MITLMKYVLLFCTFFIVAHSVPSYAAPLAGTQCDQEDIGMTQMDGDRKVIVSCLLTDSITSTGVPISIWKSMTLPDIPVCGNNEHLVGVAGGKFKCMKLSCRIATNQNVGPPFNYVSTATCNGNEFLLNGGAHSHPGMGGGCPWSRIGYVHTSRPTMDMRGWNVDGFGILEWPSLAYISVPGAVPKDTEACTIAYATCCSWIPAE